MNKKEHILLFDGVCNLCIGMVQFLIKRDRDSKFRFGSLQSETGQSILIKHNLIKGDLDTFVYLTDGKYFLKSTAALRVLRDLGGIWKLFYVFIIIPVPIRDLFYSLIAKVRYRIFGKRIVCMVPTPEIKDRFLD